MAILIRRILEPFEKQSQQTSEGRDGAYMDFPERVDRILKGIKPSKNSLEDRFKLTRKICFDPVCIKSIMHINLSRTHYMTPFLRMETFRQGHDAIMML